MRCWHLTVFLFYLIGIAPLRAQEVPTDTTNADIETLLEDSGQEDEEAQTQLAEVLADLLENPLDINSATAQELGQIPAFGILLGQRIVDFRNFFGKFNAIPELRAVEGITTEVYEQARPYLGIGARFATTNRRPARFPIPPSLNEFKQGLGYEIIQRSGRRLQTGSGYTTDGDYLGSPYRHYTRIRMTSGRRFSLNLTADKDAGEAFKWDSNTQNFGYDYLSAHLAIKNYGRFESLILGDYVAEFGQGLVLWRGIGFGKGSSATAGLIRSGRGLVAYGSSDENQFLRGLATSVLITPQLGFHAFVSKRSLDAGTELVAVEEGEDLDENVTTLRLDGYHRTTNELAKKDAVKENLVGAALQYRLKSGLVGISGYQSTFALPFLTPQDAYQFYDFTGNKDQAQSAFLNLNLRDNNHLFGEIGRDHDGTIAGIGGLLHKFSAQNEILFLYRNYPKDFTPLHGNAFGERNGETQNESGFYTGIKLKPTHRVTLNAYFDQFQFPWLRYQTYRPTQGTEWFARVDFRPKSWIWTYLQVKHESKEEATKVGIGNQILPAIAFQNRSSARLHLSYNFSRKLNLAGRVEMVRYQFGDAPQALGYILLQDLRFIPSEKVQLDFRYAFFDTDSYDARVYAYEKDVLYYMSNPAFSGQGQRIYALLRLRPFGEKMQIWLKYALTRYENETSVGSGLDEVSGNVQSDIRMQVQFKL